MLGHPSEPQNRTHPTKLEIPFGYAFDSHEVSSHDSVVCVRPVTSQSAIEELRHTPCGGPSQASRISWTNGDGSWIRGAMRRLTLPWLRQPIWALEETSVNARSATLSYSDDSAHHPRSFPPWLSIGRPRK